MNTIELKRTAIESLSLSGSLYKEGKYQEALDAAEKAWNSYFELQKTRQQDEDFTDLIYAAQAQYEKCRQAIDESSVDEKEDDKEYERMLQLKERGERGDVQAALLAAQWFAAPVHWNYLFSKGLTGSDFLSYASSLYQSVINNSAAYVEYRALASCRLGLMFLLPKFSNVDMKSSAKCFRWAANELLRLDKPTDWLLFEALEGTVETQMYLGDVKTAVAYADLATQHGHDMSVFFPIAWYGLRHNQKSAYDLIAAMVDAGTWEGRLLEGFESLYRCINAKWQDEELNDNLAQKAEDLSLYYDNNSEKPGIAAIMAFSIFAYFLIHGNQVLDNSELMSYISEEAEKGDIWCQTYYGKLCDFAASIYADEGNTDKAEESLATARKYLSLAANNGNREAINSYYHLLKDTNADAELIDSYANIASQYDIEI